MTSNVANSNWYTNAYSGPFRTTRLRAPSLLPNSRPTIVHIQQTLVVDAARQAGAVAGSDGKDDKHVRRRETIFGPDVGEDDEPGWTDQGDGEGAKVGVDVIKGWVEKAKTEEGLHATTTLQALVNLKRPTLLLQQLEAEIPGTLDREGEITPATGSRRPSLPTSGPLHTLKFNYDATSPLVSVTLTVHPSPPPSLIGKGSIQEEPKLVYTGVHQGGFNQTFSLPHEHAMDLTSAIAPAPLEGTESSVALDEGDEKKEANVYAVPTRDSRSEDTTRSSLDRSMGNMHIGATQPDLATVPELSTASETVQEDRRTPRRFGIFPRRRQEPDLEAGQIEMTDQAGQADGTNEDGSKEPEKGMRLLIKIEAVGEDGRPLKRRNAQLTHILITGMWSADAASAGSAGQPGKRVWVIKVVRREAIIGAHTFLLKEIYGLSSTSTQQTQTSYPPTAGDVDPYASTPNECIVCLTAPRDVVLLPCRHLVVCRDCAVGMVEFGAGGKVGRREDNAVTAEDGAATGAGGATPAVPNPQVAGGTTERGRERRKKKAKGWYCPVCRQPYTSLLRLALPASAKPPRTPGASRLPSRAPSIRSVRSTNTLRRVPSIAPTLPDGAERMLEGLYPHGHDDDDDDDNMVDIEPVAHSERPQFVLGPEVDEDDKVKEEVEHREVAGEGSRGSSRQDAREGAGWREVP
ncbi:hypothetical protein BCR39DRAFT_526283 [Naematelia encephala]|uniref:RING-type domain-containing protein n=1 Tax=Naematelia encephala TaxID=71784 RepID=A0A1Y2B958_9TREE|nr:hypothetical protein BCR39DRAFT_526283 [Naematelia encephala]